MRRATFLATIALGMLLMWPTFARAGTIQTLGAGSAVSSVDRSANFDALAEGTNLTGYTEGGLGISVADWSFQSPCCAEFPSTGPYPGAGFSGGFFYPWGGSDDPVHITAADGLDLFAVELNVGSGFIGQGAVHVYWEAYDNLALVGSGSLDVAKGTVLGFSDPNGFDELRIAGWRPPGDGLRLPGARARQRSPSSIRPGHPARHRRAVPPPYCSWAWAPLAVRLILASAPAPQPFVSPRASRPLKTVCGFPARW
jgi:hypothetical protein